MVLKRQLCWCESLFAVCLSSRSSTPTAMKRRLFFFFFFACQHPQSWNHSHVSAWWLYNHSAVLKPQDSFGEFNNFYLYLQKVQEIIRKHHQTFLQLFGMTYCNAILPNGNHYVHNLDGKVFRGTPNIFMFGYFLKMEAFRSELLTGH